MPFIPALGTIQCEMRATYLGVPVENVMHFTTHDEVVPPGDVAGVALSFGTAWVDNVLPFLSDQYVLREVYAFDMTVEMGVVAVYNGVADDTGGIGTQALPGNLAACISLRTGLRGRSGRGRTYLVGLTEPDVTGNFISTALMIDFVAAIQGVQAAVFTETGYELAIVSKRHNNADRAVALVTSVTSILSITNRVTSQRGRLT